MSETSLWSTNTMPPVYNGTPKSWAEVEEWASRNVQNWRITEGHARREGLTEVEKLRMLSFTMLHEACAQKEYAIRQAEANPQRVFFTPKTK